MRDHFITLFEYEAWANQRIVDTLRGLRGSPPERALERMTHIIDAQRIWLFRLDPGRAAPEDAPGRWTLDQIEHHGERIARDLIEHIGALSNQDLQRVISYSGRDGVSFRSKAADVLTHLAVHGAHHRGQIMVDLRGVVEAPPSIGFIVFTREEQRTPAV
ncbi:MAG: hypothetical protein EA376_01180 [Phycisphaeraceae bacterium]|nr:MAG: hypothetical protein EA376_01180 [Phycisphaeraceae bacterium]